MAMVKVEDVLKMCKEKNYTIPEDKMKLLEGMTEISEEELKNVAGGKCAPDAPRCPKCSSTDTYTHLLPLYGWEGVCRHCGHTWMLGSE